MRVERKNGEIRLIADKGELDELVDAIRDAQQFGAAAIGNEVMVVCETGGGDSCEHDWERVDEHGPPVYRCRSCGVEDGGDGGRG